MATSRSPLLFYTEENGQTLVTFFVTRPESCCHFGRISSECSIKTLTQVVNTMQFKPNRLHGTILASKRLSQREITRLLDQHKKPGLTSGVNDNERRCVDGCE